MLNAILNTYEYHLASELKTNRSGNLFSEPECDTPYYNKISYPSISYIQWLHIFFCLEGALQFTFSLPDYQVLIAFSILFEIEFPIFKCKTHYPFKWIQLNGHWSKKLDCVFLKNWQFSPHPFNCRKVGCVQLSSNFFLLLSLISHSRARFKHAFLKKTHQNRKYYREEKQDFWYFQY